MRSEAGKAGARQWHKNRGFQGMPYLKVKAISEKGWKASLIARGFKPKDSSG